MKKTRAFIFYTSAFYLLYCAAAYCQPSIPNKDMWITNGSVNAIAVAGDYTYIGGTFTYIGPNTGCGGKLTVSSPAPDMRFPKVSGTICSAVPDGSGGWYIGGAFTKVGSYNRNRIAHINADGTVDAAWNPCGG
ncbi:MAG: delta-60 repeat domain-containing protein [Ignavibacteriales bacterium]|nr:delta-60 repeat domain-containing protein [Ignavibacteriales bacterium]